MHIATRTLANGATMHFEHLRLDAGTPTLVLVHGWTCRRGYWKQQIEHLKSHYPMLVPDLPGHGDSTHGTRSQASVEGLTDSLVSLIHDQIPGPVVLIGHSMGGAVALEAARRIGDKTRGVILVDTFVIDYGGLDTETQEKLYQAFARDFPGGIHWLVDNTSVERTPEPLKNRLKAEMAEADPAWALPLWKNLLAWQPEGVFPRVQCPIHAINGKLVPNTARKRCRPYLQEVVMPRAGHFLHMEDAAGFNQLLDDALVTMS